MAAQPDNDTNVGIYRGLVKSFAPSQTVELQSTEALWPPSTPFTPGAAPAGLPLPPSGPEAYTQRVGAVPEVLSNDGTEGGTLVIKLNGQIIVATIKAVA